LNLYKSSTSGSTGHNDDHYIVNRAIIKDSDIQVVYEKCIDWSRKRKGKIIEENKPYSLEIARNRQFNGYIPLGGSIIISLDANDGYVELQIKHSKYRLGSFGLLSTYYDGQSLELVEDLCRHIGVNVNKGLLRALYPIKYSNSLIIGGLFFSIIYVCCSFAAIYVSIVYFSLYTSIFFFILGSSFFIFIAYPHVRELLRAVKRRLTLY